MKIIRNGIEIELTAEELRQAGYEYDHQCYMEDVAHFLEDNNSYELTEDDISKIADDVDDNLGNCDPYFESFWDIVQLSIEEYVKNNK